MPGSDDVGNREDGGPLGANDLNVKVPGPSSLYLVSTEGFKIVGASMHLQIDIYIDKASPATTDRPLATARCSSAGSKIGRSKGMDDLIDTRPYQFHLLVICVANMRKAETVVPTLVGLEGEVTARCCESFDHFARGFYITLHAVVNLEWCGPV
jgi:hypothetical protein